MSAPTTISADRLVHVIVDQRGERRWFHHTDRRQNEKTKQWFTIPAITDDPRQSVPMTFEFALISKKRWEDELKISVRLALEPNGEFLDETATMNLLAWEHKNYLVSVNQNGDFFDSPDSSHAYLVRAVHTPEGPKFCLRFDLPILQNQSVFATLEEGPEMCVKRANEMGRTKLEAPQPNPHLEARRQEAAAAQARAAQSTQGRRRPGDL